MEKIRCSYKIYVFIFDLNYSKFDSNKDLYESNQFCYVVSLVYVWGRPKRVFAIARLQKKRSSKKICVYI